MKNTGVRPLACSQCEKGESVDRPQSSRISKLKAEYPWGLCDPHYGTWETPSPMKYPQCESQKVTASLVKAHKGRSHYSPNGALTVHHSLAGKLPTKGPLPTPNLHLSYIFATSSYCKHWWIKHIPSCLLIHIHTTHLDYCAYLHIQSHYTSHLQKKGEISRPCFVFSQLTVFKRHNRFQGALFYLVDPAL